MRYSSKTVEKLVNHYKEISLLNQINAALEWDLNVNLPANASEARANQSAYITKLVSDKWLDNNFRNNLNKALSEKNLSLEEKAIVRNLERSAMYYHKVPQGIIIEMSETTSKAFMAWREAREKNDFKTFSSHLKKIINLNQIIAKHMGYHDNPYDALLGIYEPELTTRELKVLFGSLVKEIGSLLSKIKKTKAYKNSLRDQTEGQKGVSGHQFDISYQERIANFVLRKIGYDMNSGRMDISAHPFTIEMGKGDIRITNRYSTDNFIESIMVALHEGGHALYEQGVSDEFDMTPLEGGVSLGIHESQSRFWENQVGRSREFVEYLEPTLKAFYMQQLSSEAVDDLYLAFNKVTPSLIRVGADEVTYNLHIALRFELEEALLNDRVKVEDLPEIWNVKMKKYLGVVPQSDSVGVLQDVHWSYGNFGYFPTYTLGNLYAAQFTHFMKGELKLADLIKSGEFGTILSWQRKNIHKHGSLYWPKELVKRVTGKPLSSKYFIDYLNSKYLGIYKD